jgi:hypothetical protein
MIDPQIRRRKIDHLIGSAPMGIRLLGALVFEEDSDFQREVSNSRENRYALEELREIFRKETRPLRWYFLQLLFEDQNILSLESTLLEYLWQLSSKYENVQVEWSPTLALYIAMRATEQQLSTISHFTPIEKRYVDLISACSIFLEIPKNSIKFSNSLEEVDLQVEPNLTKSRSSILLSCPPLFESTRRSSNYTPSPAAASISSAVGNPGASILIVDDSSLVRKGILRDARGELVESGRLACVLSLASRQSFKKPAPSFASANLVVVAPVDKQIAHKHATILFATNVEKDDRPSLQLNDLTGIEPLLKNQPVKDFPLNLSFVAPYEVFENDVELLPDRYFKSTSQLEIEHFLRRFQSTAALSDIADIIRPRPIKKGENVNPEMINNPVSAVEILVSDLSHGDILAVPKNVDRSFSISKNVINKFQKQIIEPGDLLFSFKGTIGKISLVGEIFATDGETAYLASQGMLIIRSKGFSPITPLLLLNYLSHPHANAFFEERATGLGMKNLPVDALYQFIVPIPDIEQQMEIRKSLQKGHEEIFQVNEQIQELQKRLLEIRANLWPNLEFRSD